MVILTLTKTYKQIFFFVLMFNYKIRCKLMNTRVLYTIYQSLSITGHMINQSHGSHDNMFRSDSLLVEQDGDDDADDEDHGQDGSHHPDEAVARVQRLRVRVGRDHGVGVRAGHKHLLNTQTQERYTCTHTDTHTHTVGTSYPGGGVELSQDEEDVLLTRLQGPVLEAAVVLLVAQREEGGQGGGCEAGRDVSSPQVHLTLPRVSLLLTDVLQQLQENKGLMKTTTSFWSRIDI